jgi:hypothetical protein
MKRLITNKRLSTIVLIFVFLNSAQAYVDFDSGNTEVINYSINDSVRVDYTKVNVPGTHLILEGGASISEDLYAYNNSRITMNAGIIGNDIAGYGSSQVIISGGTVQDDIVSFDNSQITLTGDGYARYALADDYGDLRISGGTIEWYTEAYKNSSIYISGGAFTHSLMAIENGIITLEGNNFKVGGVSVNGFLDIPYLVSVGALKYTYNNYYHENVKNYSGMLTGELADGTISVPILVEHRPLGGEFADGANFNFVPEPATLLLLGFGAVLVRRKPRITNGF